MIGTVGMKRKAPGTRNTRRIPLHALSRKYDRQNDIAAAVILDNPEKHSRFQVDWAARYTARRSIGDEMTPSSGGVR